MRTIWMLQLCLLVCLSAFGQSATPEALEAYNNAVNAYKGQDYASTVDLLAPHMAQEENLNFIQGQRLLAESYHRMGDNPNAQVCFQRVLDINPHQADVLYNLGISYIRTEDFDGAEAAFAKALDIRPGYGKAQKGMDWLERRQEKEQANIAAAHTASKPPVEQPAESQPTATTTTASAPTTPPAAKSQEDDAPGISASQKKLARDYVRKGIGYYNEKEFGDAAAAFDEALSINPHHTKVHVFAGRAKMHINEADAAVAHLRKAVAKDSDNGEYHYYLAKAHEQQGDQALYEKHLKMAKTRGFEGTREVFNSVATDHYNLAVEAQQRKDYSTAVEEYKKAISANDRQAHYHYSLATALYSLKRPKEAMGALDDALALDPNYHEAYSLYGRIHHDAGSYRKAGAYYLDAINHGDRSADAYLQLGYAHNQMGNHGKAVEYFQKAADMEPNNLEYAFNVGMAYFKAVNYTEAITIFEKILETDPNHRKSLYNLSAIFTRTGRFEEALAHAHTLIEMDPNDGEAYLQAGKVYGELGDGKNKDKYMRKAKSLGVKMNSIWY